MSTHRRVALRDDKEKGGKKAKPSWKITTKPPEWKEAVDAFRARVPMTKEAFGALEEAAQAQAFTVAGVAQLDMVSQVWRSLDTAIAAGRTLEEWKADAKDSLLRAWGGSVANPPHRLDTIFRTNTQSAYSAGRWAQMTDPDVLAVQTHWMFDAVIDDGTTETCEECDGTVLPADDPWWHAHNPPLHFNAVARGTLITTKTGDVPVDAVRPGDLVLTHASRWRRVTAVLAKMVVDRPMVELQTATGRRLRVTYEHPVLLAAPLAWERAGDIEAGNEVFEHSDQVRGSLDARVTNPKDAPSLLDEPRVALEVVSLPVGAPVPLAVHLERDAMRDEGKVDDVRTDRVLCDGPGGTQEVEQVLLRRSQFLAVRPGNAGRHARPYFMDTGWVCSAHATSMVRHACVGFGAKSVSPMSLAGPLGDDGGIAIGDRHLVGLRPHRDPVPLAPEGDRAIHGAELALEGTETAKPLDVLAGNESGEPCAVGEVSGGWHVAKIIITAAARYSGALFDLSVEEDESYVAAGIIVHNCRSGITTMTEDVAKAAGIDKRGPKATPDDGFGHAPGKDGAPAWTPDPGDYPAELWDAKEIP